MATSEEHAVLDVESVRLRFSALGRHQDGSPVIYLDGPGGSQTPDAVADAIARYLIDCNANCGGPFTTSADTDRLLHEAHAAAADLLGCSAEEIVFGANTTSTIEYLESLGADGAERQDRLDLAYARIAAHESALTRYTLERLSGIPGLRLYGIGDPDRTHESRPTFCFNLDGWSPEALSAEPGRRGCSPTTATTMRSR